MHVPLTLGDFLHRAELVYGERVAVIDEPQPPGGGLGRITYTELGGMARSLAAAPDNPAIAPSGFLNELLSPLLTLLNTRDARGRFARESAMWQAGKSNFLHFGLCRTSANAPLGWVLSASTRERMEAQLTQLRCGSDGAVFDNPANLKTIDSHFRPAAGRAL
jgi:hypothetical protein